MYVAHSLVTAPTEPAVPIAMAKLSARVDHNAEDSLVASYVQAAADEIEKACNLALCTQTWDLIMPRFPRGNRIYLPRSPVASITSITYYDSANQSQTLTLSTYIDQSLSAQPAELCLKFGYSWPATYSRPNAVTVRYVAGYGDEPDVPPMLKAAICTIVGDLFENRASTVTGTITAEVAAVHTRNLRAKYEVPDLTHLM